MSCFHLKKTKKVDRQQIKTQSQFFTSSLLFLLIILVWEQVLRLLANDSRCRVMNCFVLSNWTAFSFVFRVEWRQQKKHWSLCMTKPLCLECYRWLVIFMFWISLQTQSFNLISLLIKFFLSKYHIKPVWHAPLSVLGAHQSCIHA